jgi:hypothetical protein
MQVRIGAFRRRGPERAGGEQRHEKDGTKGGGRVTHGRLLSIAGNRRAAVQPSNKGAAHGNVGATKSRPGNIRRRRSFPRHAGKGEGLAGVLLGLILLAGE